MPFARIDPAKGKTAEYRAAVADDIMVNMVFVDRADWSFGRGEPW